MPSLSNPVKAVFFDLGWTMVYPPSGDWEFTEPAKKLFRWDVYATLPEERRVQGRKAAYDTFRPRHKMATLEEEYQQNLDYYGEIARLFPELGATPQDVETAALEKVYQARHTYELFEDSIPTLEALRGKYKLGVISDTWPSIVPVLEEFACRATSTPSPTALRWAALSPTPGCSRTPWGKWACPPSSACSSTTPPKTWCAPKSWASSRCRFAKSPARTPAPRGCSPSTRFPAF